MSASTNADPDLALFREDLDALRRDVAHLIEHIKGGAANTVDNITGHIERRVRSLRREARTEWERSADTLDLFIEARPLLALMIAAGIGYVGARALQRRAAPREIMRPDRGRSTTLPSG